LAELGLEPSDVTLEQLEDRIVALEKANDIAQEERKKPTKGSAPSDTFKKKSLGSNGSSGSSGAVPAKSSDSSSKDNQPWRKKTRKPHTNRQTKFPGSKEDRDRINRL
jgi:hypothetical protein